MSKIITAADLNSYTRKTLDVGLAQQVVDAINAYVESRTHRVWGESKTVTDRLPLQRTVWLTYPDVSAVTDVSFGYPQQTQTIVNSNNYMWEPSGRLGFYGWYYPTLGYYPGANYVSVTYATGTSKVPDDLKLAALAIAQGMYNFAGNDGKDVVSVSVDNYRLDYSGRFKGTSGGTQDQHFATIASYSTRRA